MSTFIRSLLLSGLVLISAPVLRAQTINAFAGNHTAGYSGDGHEATAAQCYAPVGVAVDAAGNVYFCELGSSVIRKVNTSGIISTIAGTGAQGFSGNGGPATAAMINQPTSVAVDNFGNIYFTDDGNNMIRKIDATGIITTIAGTGIAGNADGIATAAELNGPSGIAVDKHGSIYIADVYNHEVKRIDAGLIATICGDGSPGFTGNGSSANVATLRFPKGVATDTFGNIFIADQGNSVVRRISPTGIIITFAGNGTFGYSGDGGFGNAAALNTPTEVTTDNNGNVYIADFNNHVIRKVTPSGRISTIAGNGTAGYSGDGGSALAAQMSGPYGVALNTANGKLYISDEINNVVRVTNLNTVGIEELPTASASLHIYPDPSDGVFNITIPANSTGGHLQVIDVTGRVVHAQAFNSGEVALLFNGETLAPGTYHVRMTIGADVHRAMVSIVK